MGLACVLASFILTLGLAPLTLARGLAPFIMALGLAPQILALGLAPDTGTLDFGVSVGVSVRKLPTDFLGLFLTGDLAVERSAATLVSSVRVRVRFGGESSFWNEKK